MQKCKILKYSNLKVGLLITISKPNFSAIWLNKMIPLQFKLLRMQRWNVVI
jgi:hypothetical protein